MKRIGMAVGACALAASCGGSGSGSTGGVFLDSAVAGLSFASGAVTGTTAADGAFDSEAGSPVQFTIGDILLGEADAAPVLTPVDLVPGAVDEQNPTVTNIARLLQTLDADEDPSNGIVIEPAVLAAGIGQTLDFAVSTALFTTSAQGVVDSLTASLSNGPRTLISAAAAQAHLGATLLAGVAGRYQGTFGGDDAGSFEVYIDRAGTLFGVAESVFEGPLGLSGAVTSDGGFLAGVVTSSATFTGTIDGTGNLNGTWALAPDSGTFSGVRTAGVDSALDAAFLAGITGSYTGTFSVPGETGPLQVTLDAAGNFSGPPPDDQFAATLVSIDGGTANFAGMSLDGCRLSGSITAGGVLTGTTNNIVEGVSGTLAATLDAAP